jgi:hypothetical protein
MPKKKKTKQRYYNTTFLSNSSTNQKVIKTYWRWFNFNQTFIKPNFLLNLKLPGYFTHQYDISYQYKKPEKKKI